MRRHYVQAVIDAFLYSATAKCPAYRNRILYVPNTIFCLRVRAAGYCADYSAKIRQSYVNLSVAEYGAFLIGTKLDTALADKTKLRIALAAKFLEVFPQAEPPTVFHRKRTTDVIVNASPVQRRYFAKLFSSEELVRAGAYLEWSRPERLRLVFSGTEIGAGAFEYAWGREYDQKRIS
jgi:hypothetical protein